MLGKIVSAEFESFVEWHPDIKKLDEKTIDGMVTRLFVFDMRKDQSTMKPLFFIVQFDYFDPKTATTYIYKKEKIARIRFEKYTGVR